MIDRSAGNESDQRVIRLASTTKDGVLSCGHGVCRAASRLPLEGAKMVATFKPSFGGSIFLIVALLAAARPGPAAADDRGAIPLQARIPCMVGHLFEPGPIVGGHNRQPTVREYQARAWRSCWNSSKETPTAVPRRRPALKRSGSCRRRVKRPL